MKKNTSLKFAEVFLLILVWMVLIMSPVLFRNESELTLSDFINPLKIVIPLFGLFVLNRFVLVPKLFFRKKQLLYLVFIFGLIAFFTFGVYFFAPGPGNMRHKPPYEMGEQ